MKLDTSNPVLLTLWTLCTKQNNNPFVIFVICTGCIEKLTIIVTLYILTVTPRWGLLIFWLVLSRHFLFYFAGLTFPLVSGHLPFLMCHQSDCLPWSQSVSTCSPFPSMCIYSLHLPLSPCQCVSLQSLCAYDHPSLPCYSHLWT